MTLGENETTIVERLDKVLLQIIEHEENARRHCLRKKRRLSSTTSGALMACWRTRTAFLSKETMNLLSLMKLGVDLGLFPEVNRSLVDELFIITQPAHLQKQFSDKLSAEERDLLRSDMVRERLKHVSRPSVKPPKPRD
ncbi:MAG: hypothetical protein WDN00_13145 [Limisphaerales bacterium]